MKRKEVVLNPLRAPKKSTMILLWPKAPMIKKLKELVATVINLMPPKVSRVAKDLRLLAALASPKS